MNDKFVLIWDNHNIDNDIDWESSPHIEELGDECVNIVSNDNFMTVDEVSILKKEIDFSAHFDSFRVDIYLDACSLQNS